MNLREAIGEYVVGYLQCQEVIGWDGEGAERIRRQFGEVQERLYRVVKVAEAAMAYAEYQYDTGHGVLVEMGDYVGTRDKLWKEFVVARDKAMNQS